MGFVSDADISFKTTCVALLDESYGNILQAQIVNCEWTENAISETIVKSMNDNPRAKKMHITAFTEKRLLPEDISQMPSTVDDAWRIDIVIGGFGWIEDEVRVACHLEAKNLYAKDFKKAANKSVTSSSAYAKRYITTGIDHIIHEHYPADTLLLGYVLIGSVQDSVSIINAQLNAFSRGAETISISHNSTFPNLVFGLSNHPGGQNIEHYYLAF